MYEREILLLGTLGGRPCCRAVRWSPPRVKQKKTRVSFRRESVCKPNMNDCGPAENSLMFTVKDKLRI